MFCTRVVQYVPVKQWIHDSNISFGENKTPERYKSAANEPPHDKTNKMACAPSEDSDQPGHPSSLVRVFAVRSMGS